MTRSQNMSPAIAHTTPTQSLFFNKLTKMWQEKSIQALAARDASLQAMKPPIWPLREGEENDSPAVLVRARLTEREIDLTEGYSVMKLLDQLKTRELTSEELVIAFMRRAVVAQYATNCLTELMWEEAIARARYLDSLPEPLGPLHGLPISIKENQGMQGTGKTCNVAIAAWVGDACTSDFHLHNILLNAGCIFYVRTTLPQSVMHLETSSNIYGRTTNPYNHGHTSGGSSGGEGALIGMRGSVMGIGGDIGGSIRVPAAFNGVYGFKPTTNRFPGAESRDTMAGSDSIYGVNGPMSTDRDGIELLMRVVLDAKPWRQDPSVIPQPWNPHTFTRPLKIGIQMSDGVVTPHPPVTRALRDVAVACQKAGMQIVDWVSLDHKKAWEITSSLYFPDGGKTILNALAETQEPILPLTNFIIKEQPNVKERNLPELWNICQQRNKYRADYAKHWANTDANGGGEVDVILGPVYPGAAPPHDCTRYWSYTSTWNLLDYPAAVFPVTTVSSQDDKDPYYVPKNAEDQYNYDLYEKKKYIGLPVCLQVIGRRGYDEKVLAALAEIEKAMAAC